MGDSPYALRIIQLKTSNSFLLRRILLGNIDIGLILVFKVSLIISVN